MTEDLLGLQISEHAKIAYTSLGPEERRLVDAWFDHLRNWRSDEFIRAKSKQLKFDEDIYAFQTSSDFVIVFKIVGNEVTVLSIFREEALRTFASSAEKSTP